MRRAMERHPEVPFWLCVGDVASRTGAYPEPPAPLYWIKGNNEDFDRIAAWEAGRDPVANLHVIPNGTYFTQRKPLTPDEAHTEALSPLDIAMV